MLEPGLLRYRSFRLSCKSVAVLIIFLSFFTDAASRTIRVGVYNNPPKVMIDSTGKAGGIFIELLEAIAKEEQWSLKYVYGSWERSLNRLENDSIDLMPDVAFSPDRGERFQFNQITVLSSWLQLFCRKDVNIESMSDLNGKTIAVLEGSVQQEVLRRARDQLSLSFDVVTLSEIEEIIDFIRNRNADAMINSRFFGYNKGNNGVLIASPLVLYPTTLHFTTAKGRNLDLLKSIDKHLAGMLNNPGSAYYNILLNWLHEKPRTFIPRIVFYIIISIFVALLFFTIVSIVLKWKVKQRTSELAKKNSELSSALNELKNAQEEAIKREKLHAFGQLSCGIAHDFNNLLTPILTYSDILINDLQMLKNTELLKQYLTQINNAAVHGRDIVHRLQDFYRSARYTENPEVIDINQIIRDVVNLTRIRWTHHTTDNEVSRIHVVFNLTDGALITGKKSEIHEILLNLVLNAADAMPEGGTLTITTEVNNGLEIIVKDTGIGMPEEVVTKCMQPFFTTKGEMGTGMGLTMTQSVVKEHNGTVQIKSQPGEGTEIRLQFPELSEDIL
ncbi:MAG: transporter substrate-binding domain-containing protein [Chitinispirillaceae bacterium]|nr:transporter substrate-binding domain-containing protein [Chitinispirillaceae bacterium]